MGKRSGINLHLHKYLNGLKSITLAKYLQKKHLRKLKWSEDQLICCEHLTSGRSHGFALLNVSVFDLLPILIPKNFFFELDARNQRHHSGDRIFLNFRLLLWETIYHKRIWNLGFTAFPIRCIFCFSGELLLCQVPTSILLQQSLFFNLQFAWVYGFID